MNDDFLHRMRAAPPPEFLARLKAKLDRQTQAARFPRPLIVRAALIGLLMGGAAFAITSAWLSGVPAPIRDLMRSAEKSSAEEGTRASAKHIPRGDSLSPWRPGAAAVPQTQGPLAQPPTHANGLASSRSAAGSEIPMRGVAQASRPIGQPAGLTPAPPPRDYASIVGSPAVYPYTMAVAERFGAGKAFKAPKVSIDSTSAGLRLLCQGIEMSSPDISEASRRITPAEFQTCTQNSVPVIEIKLGYEAIILARSKLYGGFKLSSRDVFLALARQVPDPAQPGKLFKNPYSLWNQVNEALPYDPIKVIGPTLSSPLGKVFVELLMEAACNTYPWIAALKDADAVRYNNLCRTVREDGLYVEGPGNGTFAFLQRIESEPTAVGVFNYASFRWNQDKLARLSLDGVEATEASVAAGTYPASRTLYLYIDKTHVNSIPGFLSFIGGYLKLMDGAFPEAWEWALVPPAETERARIRADVQSLRDLKL